jgi:hypothetical protein
MLWRTFILLCATLFTIVGVVVAILTNIAFDYQYWVLGTLGIVEALLIISIAVGKYNRDAGMEKLTHHPSLQDYGAVGDDSSDEETESEDEEETKSEKNEEVEETKNDEKV